jgi:hypothetical protein
MSKASDRVEAWRAAKRQAGYHRMIVWFPTEAVAQLDAMKYTLGLDRSQTLLAAMRALAAQEGTWKPVELPPAQEKRMVENLAILLEQRAVMRSRTLAAPAEDVPVPPSLAQALMKNNGGFPRTPLATEAAIAAAREQFPDMSWAEFSQYLFDQHIYRAQGKDGQEKVSDYRRILFLLKRYKERMAKA